MKPPEGEAPGSTESVQASPSGSNHEDDMDEKQIRLVPREEAAEKKQQVEEEHAQRARLRHRPLTDEEMWKIVRREQENGHGNTLSDGHGQPDGDG